MTTCAIWLVVGGVGALLVGCGGDDATDASTTSASTTSASTTPPSTSLPSTSTAASTVPDLEPASGDGPVITYAVQGLFPVSPPFLPDGPQVAVYADGTVLARSQALPTVAPQVWPYELTHIDPARVDELLADAERGGLLAEPPAYPPPVGMSDPPRTTVILATADGTFTHVADGLSSAGDGDPALVALRAFTASLSTLQVELEGEFYEPDRIGIVAAPVASGNDEVAWPDHTTDLAAATECTVVEDPDAVAALQAGARGTVYRQDGTLYEVAARVILPGGTC